MVNMNMLNSLFYIGVGVIIIIIVNNNNCELDLHRW